MATEIQKVREATVSQLKKTDKVIASNEAIADAISELSSELSDTLTSGFSEISAGLQELCFSIDDGFREVSYKLDLQNKTLEAIREILERPLDTQAKELRKRAETAYLNNWIDEAESDLLEAEKKNYQDFIVHHILGNIYYHHKKNYQKALEYYQKAAKYAAPQSKKYACNALLCAGKTYWKLGKLSDAYKSTKMAMELLPEDSHVLYNHAGYSLKTNHIDEFMGCLRKSVLNDPKNLMAADVDEMFNNVKGEIKKLAEGLRDEKRNTVNMWRQKIDTARKEAETLGINDFASLDNGLAVVNKLYNRNSYLDLLEAEPIARDTYKKSVEEWIKGKRAVLSKLESEKEEIKKSDRGIGWGIGVGILFWLGSYVAVVGVTKDDLVVALNDSNNLAIMVMVLVTLLFTPIIVVVAQAVIQWQIRDSMRNEIEKENNVLARLQDLKKAIPKGT